MKKFGHLLFWLIVNITFGFLQLIYDYINKYFSNIPFDTKPLINGGSLLFFSSGFVISVAFDIWVLDRQQSNKLLFALKHIIVPFVILLFIVMIYSTTASPIKNISQTEQEVVLKKLSNANIGILIAAIVYGIFSKYEQLT